MISSLFEEYSSESLSHVLGLTSITSQVQTFEKLNHVNSIVRIEAIKYISENPHIVKVIDGAFDCKILNIIQNLKILFADQISGK